MRDLLIVTTDVWVLNTLHLDWATWWLNRWHYSTVWLDKPSQMANFLYCDWSPQTRLISGLHNSTRPLSQQDRHVWWIRSPWLPKIALCHPATILHFPRLRCRGRSESRAWEWAGWHPERGDLESREGDHVEAGSSNLSRQQPEPWVAPTVVVGGKKKKKKSW